MEEESKQINKTINDLSVKIDNKIEELTKAIQKTLGEKKEYAEGIKTDNFNYDDVIFHTLLHVKSASIACSWPLTKSKMHNLDAKIEEYRLHMNKMDFEANFVHEGSQVRGIDFCIDDKEKIKFDKMVKRLNL